VFRSRIGFAARPPGCKADFAIARKKSWSPPCVANGDGAWAAAPRAQAIEEIHGEADVA
jgi:hypothetical protein